MMYRIQFTIAFVFLIVFSAIGQTHLPCGTPPGKSDWLKRYQQNPNQFRNGLDTMIYLPMTVHIVGTNTGAAYYRPDFLMESFCQLNRDFLPSNMQFFLEGEINYIDNSDWYIHSTVIEGADMMNANNVPNTINSYIVNSPAGNAGYNLPHADGVAMGTQFLGFDYHTWTHEIGHNLSVQHTFLGWEGDVYSYNTPTPSEVYYDYTLFKDTLILDTIIIDTAIVEFVPRTNCAVAADGFCDTPPDYVSFRWPCDSDSLGLVKQKDPNGVDFWSDGTNYMSYSYDECQGKFTSDQSDAMRAFIYDRKPGILYNQNPTMGPITSSPDLLFPVGGEDVQFDGTYLRWSSVPNASNYILQVNRLSNFPGNQMLVNRIVTDTSAFVTNLNINWTFHWRVLPYNQVNTCTNFSAVETFNTTILSSLGELETVDHWTVFPSQLTAGNELNVVLENKESIDANLQVYHISGIQVVDQQVQLNSGINDLKVKTDNWASGIYIVTLETPNGTDFKKIIVSD